MYHDIIYMRENIFVKVVVLVFPNTGIIVKLCLLETKLPQIICNIIMESFTWWTQSIQILACDCDFPLVFSKLWFWSSQKHLFIFICIWKKITNIFKKMLHVCLVSYHMYNMYTNVLDFIWIWCNAHHINNMTTSHQLVFPLQVLIDI